MVLQNSSSLGDACFFCGKEDHGASACSSGSSLDEKKKRLAQDSRCFRCTKKGHCSKDSHSKARCTTCSGTHAVSMCNPEWWPQSLRRGAPAESGETTDVLTAGSTSSPGGHSFLLQTFRGWIVTNKNSAYIRGIIDGGSQKTFILEDLDTKLQLDTIGYLDLKFNNFSSTEANNPSQRLKVVRLHLRSQCATASHILVAVVVRFICKELTETPVDHSFIRTISGELADELMFFSVKLEAVSGLLIAADQMWRLLTGEIRRAEIATELGAISTVLGWTFQGPNRATQALSCSMNAVVCLLSVNHEDSTALRKVWDLDSLGIMDEPTTALRDHKNAIGHFNKNIPIKEGCYQVARPWKHTSSILGNDCDIAHTRLHSLIRRMKRDSTVAKFDETIPRNINDGQAERVQEDTQNSEPVSYMPHQVVVRAESAITKLRVVFDASAHRPNTGSLNDHLETGPKMNTEPLPAGLTLENFGSYTRMLWVTAWALRFVQNCRPPRGTMELSLSTADIGDAEHLWIRHAQHKCFGAEI